LFGREKKLGIFIWGRTELSSGRERAEQVGNRAKVHNSIGHCGGRAEHYYTQIFRYFGE
jgi:hypothetical protein